MKGFELVIWPKLKECSNTDHAHRCGWWEGAGGQPGGRRLLQHPAPAPPNPQQRLPPLYRAMGTGGTSSPLPSFHLLLPPWDLSEPHGLGIWWPHVIRAMVAGMLLGCSCVPSPLPGESQMSRRTWAWGVPGAVALGSSGLFGDAG